ncbi:MAG: C1 family peptidase [Erysipelotrichales bacterium]|nr:C1 family peptidase [Erysipelotrichales bacterium]
MENNIFGLGCTPSVIDGSEIVFGVSKSLDLPKEYSFQNDMSPVLNQGKTNMCVTYSLGAHIDWNINMDYKTERKDNHVDRLAIYNSRKTPGDIGMTFKEAFSYLRNHGVKTDVGNQKIEYYAKINDIESLKEALIINGPCVGGMVVYNYGTDFWNKKNNDKNQGGHAISIVGYNKDGFIIRNSWGSSWAFNGYSVLPYKDFKKIFEIWTIID